MSHEKGHTPKYQANYIVGGNDIPDFSDQHCNIIRKRWIWKDNESK